ncbi:hypothetical protein PR202_gb16190 [Eleusine coracana subsp. coracana]|uniref:Secreted protein n=1 Tax=Eleusine coracana subsp. coracana TaxID=191504 RepID=A0AAV5EZX7_ELECO|nr:hypothetical protein QOZ80_9BG0701730 [Eleusine coracana subsp. coracana]GJN28107.1 hypothetical protein PR202_gb16190 [Eleusine coracana subsp. coracana]
MGLGLGCFCAASATGRKVSPDACRSGESAEAKEQQRVVKGEKVRKGDEAKHVEPVRKEKKRDNEKKAAMLMRHQFPFHSRPGLL